MQIEQVVHGHDKELLSADLAQGRGDLIGPLATVNPQLRYET